MGMGIGEWIAAGGDCLRPRIIVNGRDEVTVEGHTGLFSYETEKIRVRTPKGTVTILGEGMILSFFGAQDLAVRGRVHQILLDGEQ